MEYAARFEPRLIARFGRRDMCDVTMCGHTTARAPMEKWRNSAGLLAEGQPPTC
jgi:hypothetical protein